MDTAIDLTSPSPDTGDMPPSGAQTLSQLAEKRALDSLSEAVEGYQSTASYCCGGSLPITMPSLPLEPQYVVPVAKPPKTIALRWDTPDHDGSARKVDFPLAVSGTESSKAQALFEELLKACAPATFGRNNEDILDETYRKAGKLDRDQFSVDFHPHDYAIIDAISQILLPQIDVGFMKERAEHRGVLAELYKVNIYSGPSDKFQAHVDTPRGPTQFGSLVVCLPHSHEGGQLRVSHKGHSTFFDWSNTDSQDIQWAAFYSDCEHEVLEVKSGHRITLTYNLYITEQVGGVLQRNPTADPSLFPLYDGAKQMLSQPNFMEKGGILGFYCAYKYAHHTSRSSSLMPWALKGVDVAIYSVFRSLGLDVFARPILKNNSTIEGIWERKVEMHYYNQGNLGRGEFEEPDFPLEGPTRVGTDFHATVLDSSGGYESSWEEDLKMLESNWPHEEHHGITWLNKPMHKELAMVGLTYGNQAELFWAYSRAAILVKVPPRGSRDLTPRKVEEPPVERGHVDVAVF